VRLNFTLYGSEFTYGWSPEGAKLISAMDLVREAVRRGFHGVEVPTRTLEPLQQADVRAVRAEIERAGLEVIVSAFGTDTAYLQQQLSNAEMLGARTLRTVIGGAAYGGDRRAFIGKWKEFMNGVRARLAPVVKQAAANGQVVAIENHQDAASEDLLWLCEVFGGEAFGIVLDAANPLATAEHPLTFARQVAPFVKYVHLKDYEIYWSNEGYRLVRCPVGTGVVPFREVLGILAQHGYTHSGSLERAAHEARHVRCFESDFWPEYERRSAAQLAETLAFVRNHARPRDADYRTPFEKNESVDAIKQFEERQLRDSIRAMATITGDDAPLRALERQE